MALISMGQKTKAALVTVALMAIVTLLDWVTGYHISLTVAYFVPITYAAWALGRNGAVVAAVAAEIPTYLEQAHRVNHGTQTVVVAAGTLVVRLLIYLFVAEVTTQLVKTREEARDAAERLRAALWRIEEDARAGGVLQRSALEFVPPAVEGFDIGGRVRYAQAVGGDFADAGSLDGRVYACVGDISGKGTPAALFTMLLKHVLQGVHRRGLRGGKAIAGVNAEICRTLPLDRFITLFYVEIDPVSGRVEYVNAGHPEGILYRADVAGIELVQPTGPALGVCDISGRMESAALALGPGDLLVVYSDGATDSKTRDGVRLGDEVIKMLVAKHADQSVQEIADGIVRDIEEMTRAEDRDDISVVCIKRTGGQ